MQIDVQKCSNFDMQQQQRQRHRWQKCNQARHFERPRQTQHKTTKNSCRQWATETEGERETETVQTDNCVSQFQMT